MGNRNSGRRPAPAGEQTVSVTHRVRVWDWARIEALAAREGISPQQWIRAYLRLSLDRHADPLAQVRPEIPVESA